MASATSVFDLTALLLVLSALFGWVNHRFVHLPHATGLLVMGLAASLILVGIEALFSNELLYEKVVKALRQIDFTTVVMDGMLAFLLFAGAITSIFASCAPVPGRSRSLP